jgi:hypothetical protein
VQKLVTIGLQTYNYEHGRVEEHLADYLESGWTIDSYQVTSVVLGDANASHNPSVWLVVVLSQSAKPKTLSKKSN